jgi:hypothetical protein
MSLHLALTPTSTFLCLAVASGAASMYFASREIQEVNKKTSPELHIAYSVMYPAKLRHIKSMYKRLYPEGKIDQWRVVCQVAMFVFFVLGAVVDR